MSAPSPLRDYQRDVIGRVAAAVAAGICRILIVAPTAAGKTVIAAHIAADATAQGKRALLITHRREIIKQSAKKLHEVGLDAGIIAANFRARPGECVQVASLATLHARAVRSSKMTLPPADLLIVDEAHHSSAKTWRTLIDAYPDAVVIGLTATPCRADGRGLGDIFEVLIECPQVAELQAAGWLAGTRVYAPSRPDLDGIHIRRGDYVERELAERTDTPQLVGDVITHWLRLADRRRTVVFAVSRGHAVHLRDEFGRAGVVASYIDGDTPVEDRDLILDQLAKGTVEVVVNVGCLTEGLDIPAVSCIVLARPTKSLGLFRQMVGRGLRITPGKTDLLVLDHAGAVFEHGLIEEPVEWALSPSRRAQNTSQAARNASRRERKLTTCPECQAVRWQDQHCHACGWHPKPKPEAFEVIDGELGQVDSARRVRQPVHSADEKRAYHRQLLGYAVERGFKPGWAAHKFREKFGIWPLRFDELPDPPGAEVRAWARSRLIAYAKQARA
jgi:DNA repair protein RadD